MTDLNSVWKHIGCFQNSKFWPSVQKNLLPLMEVAHHTTQNFYSGTWICKDAFITLSSLQLYEFKLFGFIGLWGNWKDMNNIKWHKTEILSIFICLCSDIFSLQCCHIKFSISQCYFGITVYPVSLTADFLLIWFHLLICCLQQIIKSRCPTLVFCPWFRFPVWVVREVVFM